MRFLPLLLAALLWLAPAASAGASTKVPKAGRISRIDCAVAAHQSYAVYVPKRYAPSRAWPILYCFAPDGDGEGFVKRFVPIAEKLGWIVAGSLTSKNGPAESNDRAARELLRDTEARFRLDGKLRVACGFSGASWVASRMAYGAPRRFAGVIALGQGLDPKVQLDLGIAVAMLMGDKERRLHELKDTQALCERHAIPGFFETFPGGHRMPPSEWLQKVLRWHDDTYRERHCGFDDESAKRNRQAITLQFEDAVALGDEGKPVRALQALRRIREGFRNFTMARRKDIDERIAELEKAPEVAAELKARKALHNLVSRDRKLGPKKRRRLLKKYEKLAKAHPGTPSAGIATETAAFIKQG